MNSDRDVTRLPVFVADAFHAGPFSGNPAAVVPLDYWLPDATLQAIAEQHNLAETAFVLVHPDESGLRPLRWFTPAREVRFCGHATLATASVLGDVLGFGGEEFGFNALVGELRCTRGQDGAWYLDAPADLPRPAPELRGHLARAVRRDDLSTEACFRGSDDALVVLDDVRDVEALEIDDAAVRSLDARGVIVTAAVAGSDLDVVSRCFYPEFGVDEDAATGSAHACLGPLWASRLGRTELRCRQASRRGGHLLVDATDAPAGRVRVGGHVRLYLQGQIAF